MCTGITSCGSPTLVTSATIALKPSLWCFCLCGTSWGAESDEELCYEHVSTSKLRPIPFKGAHILVPFIWAYVEDIWNPSMFFLSRAHYLSAGLRSNFTRGPVGNRTTTSSLSAV